MKRKVKFQAGGAVDEPSPRSQSAITNEPVGARLGRFLRRGFQRTPEQQDLVDAYRLQIPVDEIRRRRLAREEAVPPASSLPALPSAAAAAADTARRAAPNSGVGDAEGTPVAATQRRMLAQSARPRPAARPAPARRELTMEEIRALRSGERAPRTSEERALIEGLRDLPQPRQRMSEADMLNERELQRIRAERMAEERMGGSGNIGAASARERGEQVGPPGQYNMKKGGKVPKPVAKKAGGMIAKPKAAPKKMMKGGVVAKPKVAVKSKAKPMPFKKGGVIKKGRK